MKPAIEIIKLGKQYKLTTSAPYVALRDVISESAKNLFSSKKKEQDSFWALRDINLSIEPGERVGIIGRNGAGKSTLLKIISRITPPTTGEAIIRGRVGSLLEVGTGFHPELSGRENIYLNGSILGLKKAEITKQLDAIIDFSGVEKFIDTPLKHYSSGMQLRLAFSVAAHLEPEILLIDEVLAVGDMEFQKKCLGKMEEVSKKDGRTIVFVSHNINAINSICTKAFLLEKGVIILSDTVKKVIEYYTQSQKSNSNKLYVANKASSNIFIAELMTINGDGISKQSFSADEKIGIKITIHNNNWLNNFQIGLGLNSTNAGRILIDHINCSHIDSDSVKSFLVWLPADELTPNTYSLDISLLDQRTTLLDFHKEAISFEIGITDTKFEGLGYDYGIISKKLLWQHVE